MPIVEITVPQLGEGLQEAIVRHLLKSPGDEIKRDETIYVMDTDKAMMDVESPFDGTLQEWLVQEDDIIPIGAPIARITTAQVQIEADRLEPRNSEDLVEVAILVDQPVQENRKINAALTVPPRTRAYCRQMEISEEEIDLIPRLTSKLMPEDVDRFLKSRESVISNLETPNDPKLSYREYPLSRQQRTLAFHLKRSVEKAIPGTLGRYVEWGRIQKIVQDINKENPQFSPSEFQVFSYCVTQATKNHPRFRSTLLRESIVREYDSLNLGFAVARANDELVTAVVEEAEKLSFINYVNTVKRQILRAIKSGDQATEATQMILSYLGSFDIIDAVPTLVAPATAILFIGTPHKQDNSLVTKLALTFDHRLINGVGGAKFLAQINDEIDELELSKLMSSN